MNVFKAVKKFHEKYDLNPKDPWSEENVNLRTDLIYEEVREVNEEISLAFDNWFLDESLIDKKALTKELSDLLYVVVGMAESLNLPLEEVFKRTHESNMTKNGGKREDGKLLKGDGYVPPVLDDLFVEPDYMPSESDPLGR